MASFTDRELDVMAVLWDRGPSTVAEVRENLEDPLAYTTVLTVLRTLETKGYVSHEEEGKAHRYRSCPRHHVGVFSRGRVARSHAAGSQWPSARVNGRLK